MTQYLLMHIDFFHIYSYTPPIVFIHDHYSPSLLILFNIFEVFYILKHFNFFLEKMHRGIPWPIINKGQHILGISHGWVREWAHDVDMNKINGWIFPPSLRLLKFIFWMLSKYGTLTNSIRNYYVWQTCHHTLLVALLQVVVIEVKEYIMP